MAKLIIYISGGNFQGACCDDIGTEIMVVDYDNIDAGDPYPSTFDPVQMRQEEFVRFQEGESTY